MTLHPSQVSACLVTRGDVDMTEILVALDDAGVSDVVIWNNALEENFSVYGRYAVIAQTRCDRVFVQDDDCVLEPAAILELLDAYEPMKVTANNPQRFRHDFYRDHCLVGFGAIFDRGLPDKAFTRFGLKSHAMWGVATSPAFDRTCDVVFTALTPRKLVDVPYRDLPWASAPGRMWTSNGHVEERQRMLDLALQVRDA